MYGSYKSPIKYRFNEWKKAAKRRGILWRLKLTDIQKQLDLQKGRCFYTTATLKFEPKSKYTISLDRLDSKRGYTKTNIVFCAADINRMKSDFDTEKFYKLCSFVTANSLLKGLIK